MYCDIQRVSVDLCYYVLYASTGCDRELVFDQAKSLPPRSLFSHRSIVQDNSGKDNSDLLNSFELVDPFDDSLRQHSIHGRIFLRKGNFKTGGSHD